MDNLPPLPEPGAFNGAYQVYTASEMRAYAEDAVRIERQRCIVTAAIHSQYPITDDFDRGYAKARKDCAAAIRARSLSKDVG